MSEKIVGGGLKKRMKHLFVRHIVTSQAYNDATPAERKKFFEEMGKVAKENGFKLVFWGTPFGVPESLSMVFESDKSLDGFVKWGDVWGQHMNKLGWKSYGVSANTTVIIAPE